MEEKQQQQQVPIGKKHFIPIDDSTNTEAAFEYACEVFDPRDTFVLAHGQFTSRQFETETDFFSPVPDWDTATTEDVHYKRILSKYKRLCEEKGRNCVVTPPMGYRSLSDLANKLCDAAMQNGASDIVMGSRGLGALTGMVLGSVSSTVARECPCPVMIVKAKEKEHKQKDKKKKEEGYALGQRSLAK